MSDARHHDDELFADLVAYDAALLAGKACVVDPSESWDLREAKACLDELETLWPRHERTPSATRAPSDTLSESLPQMQLGRFQLIRELGRGGGGVVYLAHDPTLRRQVALKVPRAESLFTPELRRRFIREAEVAAQLNHRHIIPVHEAGEADGVCYLVSAYCSGPNLGVWSRGRNVTPRQAALIVAALSDGVAHMHGRGILHRDIKPSNVLLEFDDRNAGNELEFVPQLTDFGLAKLDRPPDASPLPKEDGERMTYTGAVIGTPAYMAPEQAEGRLERIGMATDVYALGVVLYELLAGQPPFRGATDVATLQQVVGAEPRPLRSLRPDVPRDLEAVCSKCLEKNPGARYATALELGLDLRNFLEGKPTLARPVPVVRRGVKWARRHPALAAAIASAVVAVTAVVAGLVRHTIQQQEHNVALTRINAQLTQTAQREHEQRTLAEEREQQLRLTAYADRFDRALGAFRDGNVMQSVEWLDELQPGPGAKDLRGFEWHYLKGMCHPLHAVWRGQLGGVHAVAIAPDGRTAASGGGGYSVRLWEVASGKELAVIRNIGRPDCLAFSRDGRALACAAAPKNRGKLTVIDVEQASVRAAHDLGPTDACHVAYCPDGATFVLSTSYGFGFWDVATIQRQRFHPVAGYKLLAVAVAPDGHTVATANDDGTVRVWEAATGSARAVLAGHTRVVSSVAYAPDGTLASASWDNSARIWDIAGRRARFVLPHAAKVRCVTFAGDGRMATAADDGDGRQIRLWDAASGRLVAGFGGFVGEVDQVAFVSGSPLLIAGCSDRTVKLFRTDPAPPAKQLPGHAPAETWSLAFTRDGGTLASGGDDHQLRLWDMATGQQRTVSVHDGLVAAVAASRDGATLASAGYDGRIHLFDARTGVPRATLTAPDHKLRCLALSPDGRIVAAGTRDAKPEVCLWDVFAGRTLPALSHASHVYAAAFSPSGKLLVSAGEGSTIRWWDAVTWQLIMASEAPERVNCIAFTPDGKTLASGSVSGEMHLWDVATKRLKATLRGHQEEVFAVTCSPDGRTLCSSGKDKTVRLWQADTGRQLAVLEGHMTRVNAVAFAPDSRTLASASHDGIIRLWTSLPQQDTGRAQGGRWQYAFGEDGVVRVPVAAGVSAGALVVQVALQPDGKILVAGSAAGPNPPGSALALTRFLANGDLDPSFGAGGSAAAMHNEVAKQEGAIVVVLPDGKLAVAGTHFPGGKYDSPFDFVVARFLKHGALDRSFAGEGVTLTDYRGTRNTVSAAALTPDGKLLVAGSTAPHRIGVLARYQNDGRLDPEFGQGGMTKFEADAEGWTDVGGLAVQPDGRLLISGNVGPRPFVVRMHDDGLALDPTFGAKGRIDMTIPADTRTYNCRTARLSDGKIMTATRLSDARPSPHELPTMILLARYDAAGKLDVTYGESGRFVHRFPGVTCLTAVTISADGGVLVAGEAGHSSGGCRLARFTSAGRVDVDFGDRGLLFLDLKHPGSIRSLALQPDGKIIAAGEVVQDSVPTIVLYRFHPDGRPDARGSIARAASSERD